LKAFEKDEIIKQQTYGRLKRGFEICIDYTIFLSQLSAAVYER
jgi:hypothetical protein